MNILWFLVIYLSCADKVSVFGQGINVITSNEVAAWETINLVDLAHALELNYADAGVTFHLRTRKNMEVYQEVDENTIAQSNFDPSKTTIVTIHGFQQSKDSNFNYGEHNAWLNMLDCNAIAVDYLTGRLDLLTAVQSQPLVAQRIAAFMDYLVANLSVDLNRVIYVGHSLGAHVSGFASRYLKAGKVSALIALDAGNPHVTVLNAEGILRKDDAHYTECIVTSGGRLGSIEPLCQANFYAGGGLTQAGCLINVDGLCSHKLSIDYHIEAIHYNNFISYRCDNYLLAILGKCKAINPYRMGDIHNIYNKPNGIFYTPVNVNSPYGKGEITNESTLDSNV